MRYLKACLVLLLGVAIMVGCEQLPTDSQTAVPEPQLNKGQAQSALSQETQGKTPLAFTPVYWYMEDGSGNDPADFADANWEGLDNTGEYWDTSTLQLSAGYQTVHDVLEFFGAGVLKRDYFKPYVSVHQGDGLYSSKGELINYEFKEEFGGEKRRAVVTTNMQLDTDADEAFDWFVQRADYFTRGQGPMEYFATNMYAVWDDDYGDPDTDSDDNITRDELPPSVLDAFVTLIEAGPTNVGGVRP